MDKSVDFTIDFSSTFLVDPGSKLNVSIYHRAGVTRLALHLVWTRFFSRAQEIEFGKGYAGVPSNGDLSSSSWLVEDDKWKKSFEFPTRP